MQASVEVEGWKKKTNRFGFGVHFIFLCLLLARPASIRYKLQRWIKTLERVCEYMIDNNETGRGEARVRDLIFSANAWQINGLQFS